jgi:hypothetical protein
LVYIFTDFFRFKPSSHYANERTGNEQRNVTAMREFLEVGDQEAKLDYYVNQDYWCDEIPRNPFHNHIIIKQHCGHDHTEHDGNP